MYIGLEGNWDFFMGENHYIPEGSNESLHPALNEMEAENETLKKVEEITETAPKVMFDDTIQLPTTTEISKKGQKQIEKGLRAHLSRVYPFTGKCYYRKCICVPKEAADKGLILVLERTKYTAVYFDGKLVSQSHETLIPQEHILAKNVCAGEHEILIVVDNHLTEYKDFPACAYNGHQFTEHTQTNWNGIVGKVFLKSYQGIYKSNFKIKNAGNLKECILEGEVYYDGEPCTVLLCADIPELGISKQFTIDLREGVNCFRFSIQLPETMIAWDEFHKKLYEVNLKILKKDEVLLSQVLKTGFRSVMTKGKKILVNNKRIFLRGTIDCAIFPLTGVPPTTKEEWLEILGIMKLYGLNHYRFHSWCPTEAAFLAADELGMYLQVELPIFAVDFTGEEGDTKEGHLTSYIYDQAEKVIDTYGNHPSFLMFAIGNEMIGNIEAFNKLLAFLKTKRVDILYSQGVNNSLEILGCGKEDQFWVTMRTASGGNNIRASFAHADLPLGHLQGNGRLGTNVTYDNAVADSNIPVISHETGQYEIFPDIKEAEKYTGVTRSTVLESWKEKMLAKGLENKCEEYLEYSGALAVQCYQEDMEALMRTEDMSGFQLLSIQDFPGQGTALIGIRNSFLEDKGVVTPNEFRRYCDSRTIYAKLPYYTYTQGEEISLEVGIFNYGEGNMPEGEVKITLLAEGKELNSRMIKRVSAQQGKITTLPEIKIPIPKINRPAAADLILTYKDLTKTYPIWIYPNSMEYKKNAYVVSELNDAAIMALKDGKTVVLFSDKLPKSIEAGFTTDFWSYPMFKTISESRNMKVAPGTMGLVIDNTHKALELFPTKKYASWQWQQIVTKAKPVVLDEDEDYQLIVEVIDNFERGYTLGLLYEKKYENGKLLICTADLPKHLEVPEIRQLYNSIMNYA